MKYGYVPVGAGPACCVTALRLGEDPLVSAPLLEAGGKTRLPDNGGGGHRRASVAFVAGLSSCHRRTGCRRGMAGPAAAGDRGYSGVCQYPGSGSVAIRGGTQDVPGNGQPFNALVAGEAIPTM